jgi:hypothetical protein
MESCLIRFGFVSRPTATGIIDLESIQTNEPEIQWIVALFLAGALEAPNPKQAQQVRGSSHFSYFRRWHLH